MLKTFVIFNQWDSISVTTLYRVQWHSIPVTLVLYRAQWDSIPVTLKLYGAQWNSVPVT